MFNVTGSEIVILLLLALVILGPEKLPDAVRRFGHVYGELRRMSNGFQSELREALDEPMRELRETADLAKKAIEEPANEISSSAKGLGQSATDAFAKTKTYRNEPPKRPTPPVVEAGDAATSPAASEAVAPADPEAEPTGESGTETAIDAESSAAIAAGRDDPVHDPLDSLVIATPAPPTPMNGWATAVAPEPEPEADAASGEQQVDDAVEDRSA